MSKVNLPKIQDLEANPAEAFKYDQLKQITNHPPNQAWVKAHPFARGVQYLPIDKVEFLLDRIFQQWRAEVKEYKQLFNSVTCCIRLHYKDPVTGDWNYHDGVGAVGIQTDKGKAASDLTAVKQDAVMKALPAAKSYAIKDAAEHFGALFGRDLNRKDTLAFQASRKGMDSKLARIKELYDQHQDALNAQDVEHIERIINNKETSHYDSVLKELQTL